MSRWRQQLDGHGQLFLLFAVGRPATAQTANYNRRDMITLRRNGGKSPGNRTTGRELQAYAASGRVNHTICVCLRR